MKTKILALFCVLLCFATHAQKKKTNKKTPTTKSVAVDSTELLNRNQITDGTLQAQDEIVATLTGKDKTATQNGEKRFYDSYKIALRQGDELTIEHTSENFRVMMALKSPNKGKEEFSYDSKPFSGFSTNKLFMVVPTTGVYTLLATSTDVGQVGKYKIKKSIAPPNAVEAQLDPNFAKQFKTLSAQKAENFKGITGEKIKKDKKDKSVGVEKFKSSFELVTGRGSMILQENGGTVSNYKSVLFESESEEEAKAYFEKTKKQLQVLVRSWTEQTNTDNNYSASTDKDIITLSISTIEAVKKKKAVYLVNFVYN
ncbi:MAG: hypothetical protein U5N85_15035 [Arcicella sp.]|nr:hypothetical protein [Arcicella sp.]